MKPQIDGGGLTVEVGPTEEFGPSSGGTIVVASGNVDVPGSEVEVGLGR